MVWGGTIFISFGKFIQMILFKLFLLIRIKQGLESNGGKGCTKCTEMASKHLFCAWLPYVSFNLLPDAIIRH